MENWKRGENGQIAVSLLLDWETARSDRTGLIRIVHARNPEERERGGESVQLALSAKQASALAANLRDLADRIESAPAPTQQ